MATESTYEQAQAAYGRALSAEFKAKEALERARVDYRMAADDLDSTRAAYGKARATQAADEAFDKATDEHAI